MERSVKGIAIEEIVLVSVLDAAAHAAPLAMPLSEATGGGNSGGVAPSLPPPGLAVAAPPSVSHTPTSTVRVGETAATMTAAAAVAAAGG